MVTSEWDSSLMDCCSPCGTCVMAACLSCIVFGKTSERMNNPGQSSYSGLNSDCCIFTGLGFMGLSWIYIAIKRTGIREQFGIEGSQVGDWCTAIWCPCCAVLQQDKEVVSRTEYAPVTDGYKLQGGMRIEDQ
ncbi:PLAC8 family protein [Colletotrichum musicola]|uniref:PLAC8 family protein n=1 Tax=Colletotrichum musicola TaxID=2175873 RepID=A0A8H6KYN4_9PEZI|nr:PLAC8 family protein [Colletotrichum musicola]